MRRSIISSRQQQTGHHNSFHRRITGRSSSLSKPIADLSCSSEALIQRQTNRCNNTLLTHKLLRFKLNRRETRIRNRNGNEYQLQLARTSSLHGKNMKSRQRSKHRPYSSSDHNLLRDRHKRLRSETYQMSQSTSIHFNTCYSLMEELFDKMEIELNSSGFRFLDVACAPGGFSQFLLDGAGDRAQCLQGFGITLPFELGGFEVMIDPTNSPYHLCYFDLLSSPVSPLPSGVSSVDIVIADAQYLPGKEFRQAPYRGTRFTDTKAAKIALLVNQFRLAFEALADGGTFLFRFAAHTSLSQNAYRLIMLCFDLFESLKPFKSEYVHCIDPSFYLICRGFRRKQYIEQGIFQSLSEGYSLLHKTFVPSPPRVKSSNSSLVSHSTPLPMRSLSCEPLPRVAAPPPDSFSNPVLPQHDNSYFHPQLTPPPPCNMAIGLVASHVTVGFPSIGSSEAFPPRYPQRVQLNFSPRNPPLPGALTGFWVPPPSVPPPSIKFCQLSSSQTPSFDQSQHCHRPDSTNERPSTVAELAECIGNEFVENTGSSTTHYIRKGSEEKGRNRVIMLTDTEQQCVDKQDKTPREASLENIVISTEVDTGDEQIESLNAEENDSRGISCCYVSSKNGHNVEMELPKLRQSPISWRALFPAHPPSNKINEMISLVQQRRQRQQQISSTSYLSSAASRQSCRQSPMRTSVLRCRRSAASSYQMTQQPLRNKDSGSVLLSPRAHQSSQIVPNKNDNGSFPSLDTVKRERQGKKHTANDSLQCISSLRRPILEAHTGSNEGFMGRFNSPTMHSETSTKSRSGSQHSFFNETVIGETQTALNNEDTDVTYEITSSQGTNTSDFVFGHSKTTITIENWNGYEPILLRNLYPVVSSDSWHFEKVIQMFEYVWRWVAIGESNARLAWRENHEPRLSAASKNTHRYNNPQLKNEETFSTSINLTRHSNVNPPIRVDHSGPPAGGRTFSPGIRRITPVIDEQLSTRPLFPFTRPRCAHDISSSPHRGFKSFSPP